MVLTVPRDSYGRLSGHTAPWAFPQPEQTRRRAGKKEGQRKPSYPADRFSSYTAHASARAALNRDVAAPAPGQASALSMGLSNLQLAGGPENPAGEPDDPQWPSGITSVMLRSVPNCYLLEEVVDECIHAGFGGYFDFLYLPMDFKKKGNKGYAFLNFRSPFIAKLFHHAFHGPIAWRTHGTGRSSSCLATKCRGSACLSAKHPCQPSHNT